MQKDIYSLHIDVQKEIKKLGAEGKMNDYIGVQKSVLSVLEKEDYFKEVLNVDSGMIIAITKKGIKETLGSGKRFQNLPRKIKELKLATLRSLPEIIRFANLIQDNAENFHNNSSKYAYLMLEAEINGTLLGIRIDVKKTSAKNKFWLHMIDIKEKSQLLSPSQN